MREERRGVAGCGLMRRDLEERKEPQGISLEGPFPSSGEV